MMDLLSTSWGWILGGLGLIIVYYFLSRFTNIFKSSKRVTLKSSLRAGDVLYFNNHTSITYYDGFPIDNYDDDLHHRMYDDLDIVEIIRLSQF